MPLHAFSGSATDNTGWTAAGETWTYASADDPTFTFTIAGVDLTGKYTAGMRVMLTQSTVKYFIITKVAFSTDTTITIYGGTDYDLANAAIWSPNYSLAKAPVGFPLSPDKWTVTATDTSSRTQASPVNGTWYNLGSFTISIPIGVWDVDYEVDLGVDQSGSDTNIDAYVTLSTANNSEVDLAWTAYISTGDASAAGKSIYQLVKRSGILTLADKTSYFLNSKVGSGGSNLANLNNVATARIRAVCAYL